MHNVKEPFIVLSETLYPSPWGTLSFKSFASLVLAIYEFLRTIPYVNYRVSFLLQPHCHPYSPPPYYLPVCASAMFYKLRRIGLEPMTSWLWAKRATNCSIPRYFVERRRLELRTLCLQSRCSSNWANTPWRNDSWICGTFHEAIDKSNLFDFTYIMICQSIQKTEQESSR